MSGNPITPGGYGRNFREAVAAIEKLPPSERSAIANRTDPPLVRTLRDDHGVKHLALRPNGATAWWTPIACGDGICLPGSQTSELVDCPECLAYMEARP